MKTNRSVDRVQIIIFLVLIYLFFIFTAFQSGESKEIWGKGPLGAERPTMAIDASLSSFPKAYEEWFNNSIIFKKDLLTLNSLLFRNIFNLSSKPQRAILGKNGWMFLGNFFDNIIEKQTGTFKDTRNTINTTVIRLSFISRYLKSKGIAFLVVIVPDKQYVYSKFLPEHYNKLQMGQFTRQFRKVASKKNINILDLGTALKREAENNDVYYKSDSHWNSLGSFIGYKKIMASLNREGNFSNYLKMSGLSIVPSHPGDIARMLSLEDFTEEVDAVPQLLQSVTHKNYWLKNGKKMFENFQLTESYKSPAKTIYTDNALNDKSLLFIHDSFGRSILGYLLKTFRKTVHMHTFSRDSMNTNNLLEQHQPDAVVYLTTERNINSFVSSNIEELANDMHAIPQNLLLEISGKKLANNFRTRDLGFDNKNLTLSTTGKEPLALIPIKGIRKDQFVLFTLDVEASQPMTLQLSYGNSRKGEEEKYQKRIEIKQGHRTYSRLLAQKNIRRMRIRFKNSRGNNEKGLQIKINNLSFYRCKW